jgi:hypothetical protein
MALRKRLSRRIMITGAATAVAIGASAGVALAAAITFSIHPGGNITASAGTTKLTDKNTGSVLTCATSKSTGTLKSGSGIGGANLGSIKTLTFSNCVGPLGLTFTVTNSHFPWKLSGASYNATSGKTTGHIAGIHSVLSGPSCSATVDGTGATADNGKVKVTYTNSTHKLKVLAGGGNLHVYNVSGCAGLINSGDATTFVGTYKVSPAQTITSP